MVAAREGMTMQPQPPCPMTRTQRARLSAFIQHKRRTRQRTSPELGAPALVGLPFTPERHGLTWAQCRLATWLLARANQQRPLTGTRQQVRFRQALRIAGMVSSIKAGRVGNSAWGRKMLATEGGNALRDHALHHLRAIAPVGHQAAKAARERQQAQQWWEETGQGLPVEEQTLEDIPPWRPPAQDCLAW
jgi:hypothetical protein